MLGGFSSVALEVHRIDQEHSLAMSIAANEKPLGGVGQDGLKDSDQAASAGRLEAIAVC